MYEKINEDLKNAMKEKDTFKLSVLRMLKSALQLEQIAKKHELDDNEIAAVLKKQVKLRKDSLEEYKKYFNYKDKSFSLKNFNSLDLEYKILRLGKLLDEVRSNSKYIKYNSLPKNLVGKEIRNLTKEIKEEILKDKNIFSSTKDINKSIEEINNIFLKVDKENKISNIGFEKAIDSKLVQNKLEKYDNYVLNAIVNHSLYTYRIKTKSKEIITMNDLVNEAVLLHYKKEKKKQKNNLYKKVLKNYFENEYYYNRSSVANAFKRLKYNQDKIAEQFYEMLSKDDVNLSK